MASAGKIPPPQQNDEGEAMKDQKCQQEERSFTMRWSEDDEDEDVVVDVEEEEEDTCLIKIKSQGDEIFEQDCDPDDIFLKHQLELLKESSAEVPPGQPSRKKRKSDISCLKSEQAEGLGLWQDIDDGLLEYGYRNQFTTVDEFQHSSRKRKSNLPLYCLDPNDYAHDLKQQSRIRRAIVTNRHHHGKKLLIFKLIEETTQLRKYVQDLKSKILELRRSCECAKGKAVSLKILDVEIPAVSPTEYLRNFTYSDNRIILPSCFPKSSRKRAVEKDNLMATVVNGTLPSPSGDTSNDKSVPDIPNTEKAGPLINITSPWLSLGLTVKPFENEAKNSGEIMERAPKLMPAAKQIKTDPENKVANSFARPINKLVKKESANHVTMPPPSPPGKTIPPSRIVFAKRDNALNPVPVQTASQLLFGAKAIPSASPQSQLPLGNLNQKATTSTDFVTCNNQSSPQTNKVLVTPKGQILSVMQTSSSSTPPSCSTRIKSKAIQGEFLEQQTQELHRSQPSQHGSDCLDNLDAELMDILLAINGTSNSSFQQRNRKQTMKLLQPHIKKEDQQETIASSPNSPVSMASIQQGINLEKYHDIIIQETED